jgi:hypothetical protein
MILSNSFLSAQISLSVGCAVWADMSASSPQMENILGRTLAH